MTKNKSLAFLLYQDSFVAYPQNITKNCDLLERSDPFFLYTAEINEWLLLYCSTVHGKKTNTGLYTN